MATNAMRRLSPPKQPNYKFTLLTSCEYDGKERLLSAGRRTTPQLRRETLRRRRGTSQVVAVRYRDKGRIGGAQEVAAIDNSGSLGCAAGEDPMKVR
jgi:hypothetical protein